MVSMRANAPLRKFVLGMRMSAWCSELKQSGACPSSEHEAAFPAEGRALSGAAQCSSTEWMNKWGSSVLQLRGVSLQRGLEQGELLAVTRTVSYLHEASDQHPAPFRLCHLRPLVALGVQHVLALDVLAP